MKNAQDMQAMYVHVYIIYIHTACISVKNTAVTWNHLEIDNTIEYGKATKCIYENRRRHKTMEAKKRSLLHVTYVTA